MRWLVTIFIVDLLMWIKAIEGDDEQDILQAVPKSSGVKKNQIRRRSKRSLSDFENTINCLQPWCDVLSTYADYGCYCGYRGHGRPLDDTDKCCYYHDNCYAEADAKVSYFSEWSMGSYLTSYTFDCINGTEIICREKDNTEYGQALCECDRKASECFLANRKTYSKKLYDIDPETYCNDQPDFYGIQLETHTLMKLYTCQLQGDQDKCCVDKGYNSVYQVCCDGKIRSLPSDLIQYFGCCGNRFYDSRILMCCYGTVYPNTAHFKCCGISGAKVDTTIAVCVNGKSVEIKKFTNSSDTID